MSYIRISLNPFHYPFPSCFDQNKLGKLSVDFFLLGFFFLYLFEPFNVVLAEHRINYFWISLLHVAVSSLVFYSCFSILNLVKIEEGQWNVGKEIFSLASVLLLMGIANFLLRELVYNNPNNWSMDYFMEEIRNTFLVGILILLILEPLNFFRLSSIEPATTSLLQLTSHKKRVLGENRILISTNLKADDFYLDLEEFIYAKAEGNYVEFHLSGDGKHRKELKRITIKELEVHLKSYPWLMKTHRSYLVNFRKIKTVSGNAQGYKLSLQELSSTVPVSRGLVQKFDEAFKFKAL